MQYHENDPNFKKGPSQRPKGPGTRIQMTNVGPSPIKIGGGEVDQTGSEKFILFFILPVVFAIYIVDLMYKLLIH